MSYAPLDSQSTDETRKQTNVLRFQLAYREYVQGRRISRSKTGIENRSSLYFGHWRLARRRDRVLRVTPSMFGSQTFARIDSDEFSEWGRMSLRGTMVLGGRNSLRANGRYLTVGWSNTICCANGRTGGWNLFFDSIEDPRHVRSAWCYTWDCGRLVFLRWWHFFPLRKTFPFFCITHAVIRYTKIDKNGNCCYCFVLYFY